MGRDRRMKKMQRVFAALCGVCALGLGLFALRLGLRAPELSPTLLQADPEALACAQALMDAACAGDLETAGSLLLGDPALTQLAGNDAAGTLWDAYFASMTYSIDGMLYGSDQGLSLDITAQALDLDKLADRTEALVPGILERRVENAQDVSQIYDQNGYRQDVIEEVLLAAIRQALSQTPETRQTQLTLHLVWNGGRWQVQPEQGLLRLLSGNMTGA